MALGALMHVGRDAEARKISRFLGELPAGPRILLIEGEAGIGKTTLLQDGLNEAVQIGMTVLSACPVESEAPLAFAGLADLLETVPAAVIDGLPAPQRQAVRQAILRAERQSQPVDPRTTATAMLTLLRSLPGKRPVMLAFDDLPWLDAPSARVLSFALRRLRHEPVGLLATVRTDWSADLPRLATDSIPAHRVDRLKLGPLSFGAIRELLSTQTTPSPGRSLLLLLYEASGGNPLFALELAAKATASGSPRLIDGLDVPDSLRRLAGGRLTGLPTGTRDVLLVSALAAEPALPVICAAARQPATAHADLEAGVHAGLLIDMGTHVRFVHPLMRSMVIRRARAGDRRAAHRRLAAVVQDAEVRARHLAMAAEGPDEAIAAEAEAAARVAVCRGDYDTAGDLAELALTLTPLGQPERRRSRVILAAEQRFDESDPARACSLLESVIDAEPPGPARADLQRRLERYRMFRGEPLGSWTAALGRALDEAGDDAAVRAIIMMDQTVAASLAGNFPEAIRSAELILDLAERTGDKALEAQSCARLALATFLHVGSLRHDLISRALAGPEQPARLSIDLRPKFAVGHILHLTGDLDGARILYQQEYAAATAQGVRTGLAMLLWAQAENEGWAGDWPRAEHLAAEGHVLAEDSGSLEAMAFMSASRGLMHAYRGRIDASHSDAMHAVELATHLGLPLLATFAARAFGIAALSTGDARGAYEQLKPFAAATHALGIGEPALCRLLPDEIEALTRLGELDAAEALLEPFETRSVRLGREWGVAVAARCRGLLFAAQGELAAAEEAIEAAMAMHQRLPMPFEKARTLLAAGEIHRRARHKLRAIGLLRASLEIFERLGAPLWQRRVLDELARGGGQATPLGERPVLTTAEQRVADLVAIGHTNPEIATELFMGQRTVEAHLSRVFRKLGVRSRTELCRALLVPGPRPSS
jgi:DNA-binding CsgD family transcriptional regulator